MTELVWNGCCCNNNNNDSKCETFEEILQRALDENYEKLIIQSNVKVNQTIVIKNKNKVLTIEGNGNGENPASRIEIEGDGHCLFQIGGKGTCVIFKNLNLTHHAYAEDKREIGATIFLMSTAKSIFENCGVVSHYGFGIWGVQNSHGILTNCQLSSKERSGCVFFGKSTLLIDSSHISRCGQHGICIRGSVLLTVTNSTISDCCVRGIYAYDKSHVTIKNTIISSTRSKKHAAVEFWGGITPPHEYEKSQSKTTIITTQEKCLPEKRFRRSSSPPRDLLVTMDHVLFVMNHGLSIYCRDNVKQLLTNCFYYSSSLNLYIPLKTSCHLHHCLSYFHPYDHMQRAVHWGHSFQTDCHHENKSEKEEEQSFIFFSNNSTSFLYYFNQHTLLFNSFSDQTSHQTSQPILWEYLHNDTHWIEYDHNLHLYLSSRYYQYLSQGSKEDESEIPLPEPYSRYRINLIKFEQININTFFTRPIRWRCPQPSSSVIEFSNSSEYLDEIKS